MAHEKGCSEYSKTKPMLLTDGLYYVGVNDRTKHRFEGLWSLPQGVSYNSYLLVGSDAVALVDTVEMDFSLSI